jgi:hypothetical protein
VFDWSQLRDLIWEGRWDALVMIFHALVTDVMTYWWFGPLLVVILLTGTRKGWMRLLRYVGSTYIHSHAGH